MTPAEANDDIGWRAMRAMRDVLRMKWLRVGLVVLVAAVAFSGTVVVAYELALARVPQHRAALERLVRAHTGLDMRFNELGLRWGWYGPEAVFRRVELGEPDRSSVLLRAPQLIVGFDAWRTMQTGQLAAGRITLVSPDIDLKRLMAPARPSGAIRASAPPDAGANRIRILERWRGGRIDLQGGTLRLPDPNNEESSLTLHIRRASLRRAEDVWNAVVLVFLPERLGRTARLVAQLDGDIERPASLSGALRFEGIRLAFSGWRDVLGGTPRLAGALPQRGTGDVTLNLTFKEGRIEKADGEVRASDVVLGAPSWLVPTGQQRSPGGAAGADLGLDYLGGNWRFVRRTGGAQLQIEQLAMSREDKDSPLPPLSVELSSGHFHGELTHAPLRSVATVLEWLAPEFAPADLMLEGSAQDIDFDWNEARPEGHRLAASARVEDAAVASASGSFSLSGLRAGLSASDDVLAIELDSPQARLELGHAPGSPHDGLKLASRLEISRSEGGWTVETPRLSAEDDTGQITLSGRLGAAPAGSVPQLDVRGTIDRADVATLQQLLGDGFADTFGPAASRLIAGRIEQGRFEIQGGLDALFVASGQPATFKGSLTLRDGQLAADGSWPEVDALEARLEWNGPRIRASVAAGQAEAFQLDSAEAQWDMSGKRAARFTGRARARLEQALRWIGAHPELQEHTPHLQNLVASGDALFDFDVAVPPPQSAGSSRASPPKTRVRVAAVLEGVNVQIGPQLPPIESLRGLLAFDAGRLQRSTLAATWLGGPLTLKIAERRGSAGRGMTVQTQGFIDARKLVALSQIEDLPEVHGQTPWSGEFQYVSGKDAKAASWQGHADSTLAGVTSELPIPLAKVAAARMPLHVEISGSDEAADLRVSLGARVRTAFLLKLREGREWYIERGAIRAGGAAAMLPVEQVIAVQGHVRHLNLPAYVRAWQQLGKGAAGTPTAVDITADELAIGARTYTGASVQAHEISGATELRIESRSLGLLTGTFESGTQGIELRDLRLAKAELQGEGSILCAPGLETCKGKFELASSDTAATLAGLGFRGELSAAKGSLSGDVEWRPRPGHPWAESATGRLQMRFDDGLVLDAATASGRPFPLLIVPALLGGLARPGGAADESPGELRFKRLDAEFQLRDGAAWTSDLHFDGDAEILVRGRTGLLAHDYDHEAWVLRGEDRIPALVRHFGATPRVAAAWMALRELVGGDASDRSRIVLHLGGSWNDPLVTSD